MANLTKNIGTVTLSGAAEKITLPAVYGWVWVKNMSEGDIFAGLSEDISEGADGVMTIPAGECGRIQADGFRFVYLMGTGNALVVAQNYAECPFKSGGKGGESGGLELIGTFALQTTTDWISIGKIPGGTRLFLESPDTSNQRTASNANCVKVSYTIVPYAASDGMKVTICVFPHYNYDLYITIRVMSDGEVSIKKNHDYVGEIINIYKWGEICENFN